MADAELDRLVINIDAIDRNAIIQLDKLGAALRGMKDGMSALGSTDFNKIVSGLQSFNNALKGIESKAINKLARATRTFVDFHNAITGMDFSQIKNLDFASVGEAFEKFAEPIKKVAEPLSQMNRALVNVDKELVRKPKDAANATVAIERFKETTRKANSHLSKFGDMLKRMVILRSIRAGINAIMQGMKEGLSNAYQFSKMVGYDLANALDRLSSAGLKMKNQLGAALGGLLQTLEPILIKLIGFVTTLADNITRFFAMLNGQDTYLQAQDVVKEWDDATEGVKKYKRQLLGLDELNVLSTDKGGKGKGGVDFTSYFKEVSVGAGLDKSTLNLIKSASNLIKKAVEIFSRVLNSQAFKTFVDVVKGILTDTFTNACDALTGMLTIFDGVTTKNVKIVLEGMEGLKESGLLSIISPTAQASFDLLLKFKEENPKFFADLKAKGDKMIFDWGMEWLDYVEKFYNTMGWLMDIISPGSGTFMKGQLAEMRGWVTENEAQVKANLREWTDTIPTHDPLPSTKKVNEIADYYGGSIKNREAIPFNGGKTVTIVADEEKIFSLVETKAQEVSSIAGKIFSF